MRRKVQISNKVILIAQMVFTVLFLFKLIADIFAIPLQFISWFAMELVEVTASIGMLLGVCSSFLLVSQGQKRIVDVEMKVNAAAGEFEKYLKHQFDEWELSPTEKNITILVIKGFGNQEIAEIRGTTESTVKSQMSSIFRKTKTTSRNQLVTWMLEDVIDRLSTEPMA